MTRIDSGVSTVSHVRQLIRKSTGSLVALVQTTTARVRPYISTDGGDTWIRGDFAFIAYDLLPAPGAIDGSDQIHISARGNNITTEIYYHSFTIDSSGAVTPITNSETVVANNDGVSGSSIAIASDGTVYVVLLSGQKVMGTAYDHPYLYRRDGAGSWTAVTNVASGSQNWYYPSATADSSDRIVIGLSEDSSNSTQWARWNGSSLTGPETVTTANTTNSAIYTQSDDTAIISADNALWHRGTTGGWTSDQYTTDIVDWATIAPTDTAGEIAVLYQSGGDIYRNVNTFGSFDPADAEVAVSSANTLKRPTSRWQYHHDTDASRVDYLYYDTTNSDVHYASVEPPATTAPVSGTVTLDGTALGGAKITVINDTQNTVQGVATTAADGSYAVECPVGDAVHVLMEYDDGSTKYNDKSKPFIVTQ